MLARLVRILVAAAGVLLLAAVPAFASLADEVAAGRSVAAQLQSGQVGCSTLSDTRFEHLGEYVMDRMVGSRTAHQAMNQRMTTAVGSENTDRMHELIGRRFAGCAHVLRRVADRRGARVALDGGRLRRWRDPRRRGWDDQEGEQDPKTHAGVRDVPPIGRVRAELARHKLATGRDGDDLVFGRTAATAFVRSTVRTQTHLAWGWKQVPNPRPNGRPKHVWAKACEDALDPLTPHEARHRCGSYVAKPRLSLKEAQEALGHADSRSTIEIYQHALPGWQEQAVAKLDAYLDGAGGPAPVASRATLARQSGTLTQRFSAVPERFETADYQRIRLCAAARGGFRIPVAVPVQLAGRGLGARW